MRAGLYARVSTNDQKCEMQLREMREYCKSRGWEMVAEFVDSGWSCMKTGQPAHERIMEGPRSAS
jgi:DNA invertase Pin-like site-specific DNA recombinase